MVNFFHYKALQMLLLLQGRTEKLKKGGRDWRVGEYWEKKNSFREFPNKKSQNGNGEAMEANWNELFGPF